MAFMQLFGAICVVILLIRFLWKQTIWGKASTLIDRKFPGPSIVPIFGNTLQFETNFADLTKQVISWFSYYGSPTRVKMGPFSTVHLFKADHVEAILKSNTNISKSRDYDFISDWLGQGLLTSTGRRWFRKRKLLTPAFHFQILKDFVPIYNEQAAKFVHILGAKADRENRPFDISKLLSLCTLDIICETAMGKKLNAMENANSEYVNAILKFSENLLLRTMKPWLWSDFTYYNLSSVGRAAKQQLRTMHGFTLKVIAEREAQNLGNIRRDGEDEVTAESSLFGKKRQRLAFLDLLLDEKRKGEMDNEEIREEVDTFMFEGHDTTATGLMWAIYCIGRNPDCQKRIHDELDSILGEDVTSLTPDQLTEMKYLECCIKESQRMFPSVPIIARKIIEPLKIDENYTLPPGCNCNVQFVMLHRDPKVFPDPMKFDPDRFLPENSIGRHPFAFVPFSAGPRNCIGQKFAMMEEKVILCHLLKHFWIECAQPEESIDPAILVVLRPTKGIVVKITPRIST